MSDKLYPDYHLRAPPKTYLLIFRYVTTTRRGPKGKALTSEHQNLFAEQGLDGRLVNNGWPQLTTGQAKELAEHRGLTPHFVRWDGEPFY